MDSHTSLKNQLKDTYTKTLILAKEISKNRVQYFEEEIKQSDVTFLKKISKGCNEFNELVKKYTKPKKAYLSFASKPKSSSRLVSPRPDKQSPKILTKKNIESIADESYKTACRSKSGFGGIRYLTPSPLPVFERIKKPGSMDSDSDHDDSIAYYSLVSGKSEKIELPSFKDCIKGNQRIESQNENTLLRLNNCEQRLADFERKMNGLEAYCKLNPGVQWNLDKKMLMKLGGMSNKAANSKGQLERRSTQVSEVKKIASDRLKRRSVVMRQREAQSNESRWKMEDPEKKITKMLDGFQQVREQADCKLAMILKKIQAERPLYLRSRANLIMQDKEMYRGRIHSFMRLKQMRVEVEKERYQNVQGCKEQIRMYTKMLDYLKRYKGMPKDSMICFVEVVRELLQGGWKVDDKVFAEILDKFTHEERGELHELIEIFKESVEL